MGDPVAKTTDAATPRVRTAPRWAGLPGLKRSVRLRNGREVTLRPMLPEDRELERRFVERLSPDSRYLRLFVATPRLSEELLDRLMDVDYEQGMALMATVHGAVEEKEVGIARYCVQRGTRSGEFAIVVADDWRGTGLARALLAALIDAAREIHQLERLEGITLAQNDRMLGLARALGFHSERDPGDASVIRLRLDL